jgi:hypothetical protein
MEVRLRRDASARLCQSIDVTAGPAGAGPGATGWERRTLAVTGRVAEIRPALNPWSIRATSGDRSRSRAAVTAHQPVVGGHCVSPSRSRVLCRSALASAVHLGASARVLGLIAIGVPWFARTTASMCASMAARWGSRRRPPPIPELCRHASARVKRRARSRDAAALSGSPAGPRDTVGERPHRPCRSPDRVWPSDHAGVSATLELP